MVEIEVAYPDCINYDAKTMDDFIFYYFNNAYPDEMGAVMSLWKLYEAEKGSRHDRHSEK